MAPETAVTLSPEPMLLKLTVSPNAAVASCRVSSGYTLTEPATDAARRSLLDGGSFSGAGSYEIPVSSALYGGTAYIAVEETDLRGNVRLFTCPFEVQRAALTLTQTGAGDGTLSWHVEVNSWVTYYVQWTGLRSVIDAYAGDINSNPDAFLSYLDTRPTGTLRIIWNRSSRDLSATGLSEDKDYCVAVTPVDGPNTLNHTGLPVILNLAW